MRGHCAVCGKAVELQAVWRFFGNAMGYAPIEHSEPTPYCPASNEIPLVTSRNSVTGEERAFCNVCDLFWDIGELVSGRLPTHVAMYDGAPRRNRRCKGSGKVIRP